MKKITDELVIRQGGIADVMLLRETALASYEEYAGVLEKDDWDRMHAGLNNEDSLRSLLQKSTAFICEMGGSVAGIVYLVPSGNPTEYFQQDWAYIRLLGVLPAFRGHGIGTELMQECIRQAKSNGEKTLALHTSEFHNAARHIYEQIGFQRRAEIGPFFGKKYWIYTLSL